MLYFIHILKTGGTTFDDIIFRQYGGDCILDLNGDDIDMEFANENHLSKIVKQTCEKTNLKAVTGHFRYGLHNLLHDTEPKYIAFFRNPVEQYLSQYYYAVNLNEYPEIKIMVAKCGNIIQYMESDLLKFSKNMQTYFISEASNRDYFVNHQNEMLSQAVKNINQSFKFCGIVEHYDESLIILKEILRWKKLPLYTKHKVNKNRPKLKEHDNSIIQQINELNKYDNELYRLAYEKFNEVKSSVKFLNFKVLIFRIVNRFYQLLRKQH